MSKKRIWDELIERYKLNHRKSEAQFREALKHMVRGGSHNLRLFEPFPFFVAECRGSKITDVDGNTYVDFWQGHFGNVLGHNPDIVLKALIELFQKGQGLAAGFPDSNEKELAQLICSRIGADKIRFTTSGTLATMYAIMMAKAFTKRELVLKVGGGWHGAHPYSLKGISHYERGLNHIESAGLPRGIKSMIVVSRFNDIEDLEEKFKKYGERIACFILEPFIGAGGFIFSTRDYLKTARELTKSYGALLIFDEVVSGFRFHAGAVQSLYRVKPDLTVLGKAIGGGMPVAAVAGKEEVMALCGPEARPEEKVKFEGGTFSSHPASIYAGVIYITYLIQNESEIYPRIGKLGAKVRKNIEEIFAAQGMNVKCTGNGRGVTENSSCVGVQFLHQNLEEVIFPEQVWNPKVSDPELREKVFKLEMLEYGFNIFHGYGAISAAHSEDEIQASLDAVEKIARKWSKYNLLKKR